MSRQPKMSSSDLRTFYELSAQWLPDNLLMRFMLEYGRDYEFKSDSYIGHGVPHQCFKNAALLALNSRMLSYVEGKVSIHGVPLDHAWCANGDGVVIDPTIRAGDGVTGYFGVPFRTAYVRAAMLSNGRYGLLDIMSARQTLPKLVEFGLDEGQEWLERKHAGKVKGADLFDETLP